MTKQSVIIALLSLIVVALLGAYYMLDQKYQQLYVDYSPELVRGYPIRWEYDKTYGENTIMNVSDDILLVNKDEFENKTFRFDIVTGHILINIDTVRNDKIVRGGLGNGFISTAQQQFQRPDGSVYIKEDAKCLIIGQQAQEGCAHIIPDTTSLQQGDKVQISLREMLGYGSSSYTWNIK